MESSTRDAKSGTADPREDGFYQAGYRQAISDVLYIAALAILIYGLVQVVFKHEHD